MYICISEIRGENREGNDVEVEKNGAKYVRVDKNADKTVRECAE